VIKIVPYTQVYESAWNRFVASAHNGTFLQSRGFIEYHGTRFIDASLMAFDDTGELVAVFPAERNGLVVSSHRGLTFSGLVYSNRCGQSLCNLVMEGVLRFYTGLGIKSVIYKPVPSVFRRSLGDEDTFSIHHLGARLIGRDVSTVIECSVAEPPNKGKRASARRAVKSGVVLENRVDDHNLKSFHDLVSVVLIKFGKVPTHSVTELRYLIGLFPNLIQLYLAKKDGKALAGVLVFNFGSVVHTQYMAVSPDGRSIGALDFLVIEIMKLFSSSIRCFSFGISSTEGGKVLNAGLIGQKEHFGGRSTLLDTFEISL
jgi:hypothetical protein